MPKAKLPPKNYKWTPELAYAIGLLVTDGNLSNDRRHITLRSCDLEQLENFKKCLRLKTPITFASSEGKGSGKICYRVQFSDVQLYRWLLTIGLFPKKTYTLGIVPVPNKFFRDFLRGHLDGDGTITTFLDRYNTKKNEAYVYLRLFVRFISASETHIKWLRENIKHLTGLHGDLSSLKPKQNNYVKMWQLKFMKKESLKLLPWLYYSNNILCLSRKRQKAEAAIKKISMIKRKKYTKK